MFSQYNKPSIVFTGGNTGGHDVPNIPLIHKFKDLDWNIFYIGDKNKAKIFSAATAGFKIFC